MNQKSNISWFNPRQMDDDTILALSTAQNDLLNTFERAIETRVKNKVASKHWLITGPRGAGKSFFLRSVQTLQQKWQALNITYVLMPEELRNIFAPDEFLDEVRHLLADESDQSDDFGAASAWRQSDSDEAWQPALNALLNATTSDLIVIGVENFDQLLNRAFDSAANGSKLRRMLENEPRIMLLASAVDSSFDENYDNRLFCQFEQHPIMPWSPQAHRDYLIRRAAVDDRTPDASQLARIDAYSRFTGGNARVAAILASLLLERQDPLDASADLESTLDKMTDYYRAQLDRIPDKSSKLFDALIRGGEPCSQTQLAQRVAANQSDIAKAFIWLVNFGYIIGEKVKGEKAIKYQVADRLFCQFYRMRHLRQQQNTRLTILADLLADTILFKDKWQFADTYLKQGFEPEARTMVEMGLQERKIGLDLLPIHLQATDKLIELGSAIAENDDIDNPFEFMVLISEQFNSDNELADYIETLRLSAAASTQMYENLDSEYLLALIASIQQPLAIAAFYYNLMSKNVADVDWKSNINLLFDLQEKTDNYSKQHKHELQLMEKHPLIANFRALALIMEQNADFSFDNDSERYKASLKYSLRAFHLWVAAQQPDNATIELKKVLYSIKKIIKSSGMNTRDYKYLLRLNQSISRIKNLSQSVYFECAFAELLWRYNRKTYSLRLLFRLLSKVTEIEEFGMTLFVYNKLANKLAELGDFTGSKKMIVDLPDNHRTSIWEVGLLARCVMNLEGLHQGWQSLLDDLKRYDIKGENNRLSNVQILADVVWDYNTHRSTSEAFTVANQLFELVASEPTLPTKASIRLFWIEFINIGVPFDLLTDILAEQRGINHSGVSSLLDIISVWLDYLSTPNENRAEFNKTLDPDLIASFTALGQELSDEAKARYGIEKAGTS
ncbi:MAG: hypothetical protein ACI8WB_000466 [Phenylobacterium sp.]|jgi:hypothetical protein